MTVHQPGPATSEDAGPPRTPPSGFRLATPGNWFDLDLDPATRNQSIGRLVDARIARSPEIADRRQVLLRLLRQCARQSAEQGVVFASMMAEAAEGLGLSAGANIAVTRLAAQDGGRLSGLEAIVTGLEAGAGGAGVRYKREVSVVELSAGRAVRMAGLRDNEVPEAGIVVTWQVQYFLPVPASELVAVLTFSTPTVAYVENFTTLFDLMAESFEFAWEEG